MEELLPEDAAGSERPATAGVEMLSDSTFLVGMMEGYLAHQVATGFFHHLRGLRPRDRLRCSTSTSKWLESCIHHAHWRATDRCLDCLIFLHGSGGRITTASPPKTRAFIDLAQQERRGGAACYLRPMPNSPSC